MGLGSRDRRVRLGNYLESRTIYLFESELFVGTPENVFTNVVQTQSCFILILQVHMVLGVQDFKAYAGLSSVPPNISLASDNRPKRAMSTNQLCFLLAPHRVALCRFVKDAIKLASFVQK